MKTQTTNFDNVKVEVPLDHLVKGVDVQLSKSYLIPIIFNLSKNVELDKINEDLLNLFEQVIYSINVERIAYLKYKEGKFRKNY